MRIGLDKTFLDNNMLKSPEFMALPANLLGFWLRLQALCSSQENGGRIVGATTWQNGEWKAAMGSGGGVAVFKKLRDHRLVQVDGGDVLVHGYHLESEARYQANRMNGGKGGQTSAAHRGGARSPEATKPQPPEMADSLGFASSDAQATLKRRSSAQGEEGDAKSGEAKKGNAVVGMGQVGSAVPLAGETPASTTRAAGGDNDCSDPCVRILHASKRSRLADPDRIAIARLLPGEVEVLERAVRESPGLDIPEWCASRAAARGRALTGGSSVGTPGSVFERRLSS